MVNVLKSTQIFLSKHMNKLQIKKLKRIMSQFKSREGLAREDTKIAILAYLDGCLDGIK